RAFECKNNPNMFCFVCTKWVGYKKGSKTKPNSNELSEKFQQAYKSYFNSLPVQDQDKSYAPHCVCTTCYKSLMDWYWKGNQKRHLPYENPAEWCEPTNHETDCFFCLSVMKNVLPRDRVYQIEGTTVKPPTLRKAGATLPIPPHR